MNNLVNELKKRVNAIDSQIKQHLLEEERLQFDQQNIQNQISELRIKRNQYGNLIITELQESGAFKEAEKLKEQFGFAKEPTNNREFLLDVVRQNSKDGIKPSEIIRAFQDAKIKIHKNYIYSLIMRTKRDGEIIERNGKYFPSIAIG